MSVPTQFDPRRCAEKAQLIYEELSKKLAARLTLALPGQQAEEMIACVIALRAMTESVNMAPIDRVYAIRAGAELAESVLRQQAKAAQGNGSGLWVPR